jgi:beta-galactosidase/beta-glucuronidase
VEDGLFAPASFAAAGVIAATAELVNEGGTDQAVTARFTAFDAATGMVVATAVSAVTPVKPGATVKVVPMAGSPLVVKDPKPWSAQHPNLYTVQVEVVMGRTYSDGNVGGSAAKPAAGDESVADAVNVSTGFRDALFTADSGFLLNNERFIFRGFSDHNDMAGVGAAVPQRLNLYRVQMLRAVGGNTWRMSHNPGDPATFDLLDRLGVLSWDENRDYGKYTVVDMVDMVRRDRNHPSIVVWSMCNEIECLEASSDVSKDYRMQTREHDTTRASQNCTPKAVHMRHVPCSTCHRIPFLGISY